MESVIIKVVFFGAIEDDQVPIFRSLAHDRRLTERVDESCARHGPALTAYVTVWILKGKSISLHFKEVC